MGEWVWEDKERGSRKEGGAVKWVLLSALSSFSLERVVSLVQLGPTLVMDLLPAPPLGLWAWHFAGHYY